MADHEMKAHDRLPVLEATLGFLAAPSADADLAATLAAGGTTVSFIMKKKTGASATKVNAAATIVDAATRLVRYSWIAADTTEAGEFNGEFEVTRADGKVQTFPTSGYIDILINPDLDAAP